jgi:hypothetical protein
MYKLNLIAIVSIVAAVSFVVGMTAPAAFAQQNLTMNLENTTNLGTADDPNSTNATDALINGTLLEGNSTMLNTLSNMTQPNTVNSTNLAGQQ